MHIHAIVRLPCGWWRATGYGSFKEFSPPWPNGRGESARWTGGCIGAGNATAVRSARTKAVDYLAKVVTYLAKDVNGSAVDKEAAAHPEVGPTGMRSTLLPDGLPCRCKLSLIRRFGAKADVIQNSRPRRHKDGSEEPG